MARKRHYTKEILQKHWSEVIKYVNKNFSDDYRDDLARAWRGIGKWRSPLYAVDRELYLYILSLVDDYTLENDLPQDWYSSYGDIEDIFCEIN